MYTSTVDYLNATYQANTDTESSTELDQDAFLTVFMAQLENQDPLNPLDDTDMISQLAEFSSLEQLTTLNETMESVASQLSSLNVTSAVNYIGMDVVAEGYSLAIKDGNVTSASYELAEDAESVLVLVYDEDGSIIYNEDLGARSAGTHDFQWDGRDSEGDEQPDGTYTIAFYAEDSNGEALLVSSEVSGLVTGLTTYNGSTVLELEDGRLVDFLSISTVTAHNSGESTEEDAS